MRKIILAIFFGIQSILAFAQQESLDSTVIVKTPKDFSETNFGRFYVAPTALFAASAISWAPREEIRKFRNRYLPTFNNHFDDYLQYAPAATVYALNLSGVKGKHSLQRATVSYLFSAAIMGTVVNTMKHSLTVERPDGSAVNSFPSGHTANSFMNATFLDKEYGQYRHPLYGIAAYTAATGTAIGRQMNNRHWISDVLAGAGIGLLSTELGYYITDKIYKEKGEREPISVKALPVYRKPTFLEIRMGIARAVTSDLNNSSGTLNAEHGFNFGVNGAWFIHKNFGFGGQFAFTSFPVQNDNFKYSDPDVVALSEDIYTQPAGIRYIHIGPYFSLPLARQWFITSNLLAGRSNGADGNIILQLKEEYQDIFGANEIPYFKYKPQGTFSWSTGVGVQKLIRRNLGLKAYVNYFQSKHDFKVDYLSSISPDGKFSYTSYRDASIRFNHVVYGLGLSAFFW